LSDPDASPGTTSFPLPPEMLQSIIDHARDEAPRECCGIISGKNGQPVQLYRARNVAEGNSFYEIDPAQLIEFEFELMPASGTEIIAIYHSHPVSPAYPSSTDVQLAYWTEAVYVICSLSNPVRPDVRGFRISNGNITEVNLSPSA
jgi:proteasome lid subunit RPN8/RPN11